jgi:hypothetical protein
MDMRAIATVEPGKWYHSVVCRNATCARDLAFDEAPPLPAAVDLPDTVRIRCFVCGQEGIWTADEVGRCQGWKLR